MSGSAYLIRTVSCSNSIPGRVMLLEHRSIYGTDVVLPRKAADGGSVTHRGKLPWTMHMPIALGDIRNAILKSRRMTFTYEKGRFVADFYLLGHARRTGAYVIIAWCVEPMEEWRLFRYSLVKDLAPVGHADTLRRDFNPNHPNIMFIDTQAFHVRPPSVVTSQTRRLN